MQLQQVTALARCLVEMSGWRQPLMTATDARFTDPSLQSGCRPAKADAGAKALIDNSLTGRHTRGWLVGAVAITEVPRTS